MASSRPTKFWDSDTCKTDAYIHDFAKDQRHGCPVVSTAWEQSPVVLDVSLCGIFHVSTS